MDFQNATKGRFSGQPAAQPTQPSLLPREPNTPPYQKGECNIQLVENEEAYLPHGRKYAEKFQVIIATNLVSAINMRNEGKAALTIREADIAARIQIPLDSAFFHKAMRAIGGMIAEGFPGEPDNPFELRKFYNRGVHFKKTAYSSVDRGRQERADKAMQEVLDKLEARHLPSWPEEVKHGFAIELLKPEYMTWAQYEEAAKHHIVRDPEFAEDKEIVCDEQPQLSEA